MRPVTEKIAFKKFVLNAFRSSNLIKTFPIKHLTLVKMLSSNNKVNNGIRFQVNWEISGSSLSASLMFDLELSALNLFLRCLFWRLCIAVFASYYEYVFSYNNMHPDSCFIKQTIFIGNNIPLVPLCFVTNYMKQIMYVYIKLYKSPI